MNEYILANRSKVIGYIKKLKKHAKINILKAFTLALAEGAGDELNNGRRGGGGQIVRVSRGLDTCKKIPIPYKLK